MIHYSFILVLLIPSIIYAFGINYKHNFFERLAFIVLFLISSLQYNVGGDYSNYYIIFNQIAVGELFYQNEPLYYLLNKAVLFFDLPFNTILILADLFFFTILYKFFNKVDKQYRFMLFFIFMFSYDAYWSKLIYLRQEIAMAFLILAIQYIEKKSFVKYSLLILVGSLFHNALFLFIPFYFLYKITTLRVYFIFLVIALVIVFTNQVINILGFRQYLYYLEQAEYESVLSIGYLTKIFVFAWGIYFFRYNKSLLFTLFLIGQYISLVKYFLPMMGRIELYFIVFHIYGLYVMIKYVNKSFGQYVALLLFGLILAYNFLSLNKTILNKSDYYFWDRYKIILFEKNDLDGVTNKWIYRENK